MQACMMQAWIARSGHARCKGELTWGRQRVRRVFQGIIIHAVWRAPSSERPSLYRAPLLGLTLQLQDSIT